MVQGVRSSRGRGNRAALLQPMFLIEFEGLESPRAEMHRFRELRSAMPLRSLPFDIRKSTVALFMAEMLYRLVREVEANSPLFDFVWEAVRELDGLDSSAGVANFHLWFMVGLSRHLGFFPAGEWFWRISARDDALSPVSVSRSRRFSVVEPPPPPIAPVPEPAPVAAAVTQPPVPAQTQVPPPRPQAQTRTPPPPQVQPQPQVRQEPPARVEPPPPLRLTLVSPAQNTTLPGLTALREPTVFSWEYHDPENPDENIANSRFTLSRSAGGRAELEIRNPSRTVTIDKLAEGLWHWTVEAVSEDGRPITAETPRQLRVQPIPLLPPPENLLPERNHSISRDELRTNRYIIFEWAAVEDANAYILTIYKDMPLSRQRIFQSEPLSELNYTFAELALLDFNSEYIWQVEAVFINSEGVIEQRGVQGENTFILDVSGPGRVQPEEAGVLYGF